jgi:hypothetical protein
MSVQNPGFSALHRPASLPDALNATLQAATRRIRFLLALRYVSRALCWSSLACLLAVGMSKLHLVFETPSPLVLVGVIGFAMLTGLVTAFARRLTPLAVAKSTDRRTDLKDRLSSALEFQLSGMDPSAPFYGEQLADTTRSVQGVDLKAAYPNRLPKELLVGSLLALTLFGLYFVPSLPLFWSKEKKHEIAEVKKQGIEIIKLAEDKQKTADQQKLPETKKAAAEAKKLGEAMKQGKLTKKESLLSLQKLLKKMEETQKQTADKEGAKMKQASADLKRSLDKMQKEMAQQQKEKEKEAAAKAPQKPADPRDIKKPGENAKADQPKQSNAMKKAQEAMKQMADALANQDQQQMQSAMEKMADQMKSGQMSKEEMKQMQKALQQLAQNLKDTNQQKAGEKMQQMAEQMQQMSSMSAENMAKMAQMMQQIGQQMGKGGQGQAMMDMGEMEKLAQGLKDGKMTGGGKPGFGGNKPGRGFGGQGHPTSPMKDPDKTTPRLVARGKSQPNKGVGKSGSAQDLAKYVSAKTSPAKHLPNGKVIGSRTENGQEMQMNMTGDPDPAHSNTPYYQVYQSSKKQAESTLDKESIPATYKEQVKKYFENIRP